MVPVDLNHPFLPLILGNLSPCYPSVLEFQVVLVVPVNLQVLNAQADPVFLGDPANLVNLEDLVVQDHLSVLAVTQRNLPLAPLLSLVIQGDPGDQMDLENLHFLENHDLPLFHCILEYQQVRGLHPDLANQAIRVILEILAVLEVLLFLWGQ